MATASEESAATPPPAESSVSEGEIAPEPPAAEPTPVVALLEDLPREPDPVVEPIAPTGRPEGSNLKPRDEYLVPEPAASEEETVSEAIAEMVEELKPDPKPEPPTRTRTEPAVVVVTSDSGEPIAVPVEPSEEPIKEPVAPVRPVIVEEVILEPEPEPEPDPVIIAEDPIPEPVPEPVVEQIIELFEPTPEPEPVVENVVVIVEPDPTPEPVIERVITIVEPESRRKSSIAPESARREEPLILERIVEVIAPVEEVAKPSPIIVKETVEPTPIIIKKITDPIPTVLKKFLTKSAVSSSSSSSSSSGASTPKVAELEKLVIRTAPVTVETAERIKKAETLVVKPTKTLPIEQTVTEPMGVEMACKLVPVAAEAAETVKDMPTRKRTATIVIPVVESGTTTETVQEKTISITSSAKRRKRDRIRKFLLRSWLRRFLLGHKAHTASAPFFHRRKM
ncbi:hypothetical protein LTR66_012769 [Elasticomyces elasticus]|nr:hypothetical protein LTR66_012769 [Elasticomyces elasticus]